MPDDGIKKRPTPRPKKSTHVGKANPIRDIFLFVGFLTCMAGISYFYKDVGKPDAEAPTIGKFRQELREYLAQKHAAQLPPRYGDCDLFLYSSTIPQAGFGVFAGKNYSKGEQVILTSVKDVPIAIQLEEFLTVQLSPLSMTLKHHPTLVNIEPTTTPWVSMSNENPSVVYEAVREIHVGDELFVSLANHPSSAMLDLQSNQLFPVPQLDDYKLANDIVLESRRSLKQQSKVIQSKRGPEIANGLRLNQRTTARFAPLVAALLPTRTLQLLDYHDDNVIYSLTYSLQNHTDVFLARHGVCLADVDPTTGHWSRDEEAEQGAHLATVPVLLRPKADYSPYCASEECRLAPNPCWSGEDRRWEVCPLAPVEVTNEEKEANAKVERNDWFPFPKVDGGFHTKLAWNVVATRTIAKDDVVRVFVERDPYSGQPAIPDAMLQALEESP